MKPGRQTEGQLGSRTGGRDLSEPAHGAEHSQHQCPRTAVCGLGEACSETRLEARRNRDSSDSRGRRNGTQRHSVLTSRVTGAQAPRGAVGEDRVQQTPADGRQTPRSDSGKDGCSANRAGARGHPQEPECPEPHLTSAKINPAQAVAHNGSKPGESAGLGKRRPPEELLTRTASKSRD